MTVQATELLATPTVPCFPAGGTLPLELCNKTNFSFSILLSLLLQTSAEASCFQWSYPEIHLSPLALQRVGASPGVRHHLGFSPLGMSGERESWSSALCPLHPSFCTLLHGGNGAKQMRLDSLTQVSSHPGTSSPVPLHGKLLPLEGGRKIRIQAVLGETAARGDTGRALPVCPTASPSQDSLHEGKLCP